MNRCPITYELCGDVRYSQRGIKLLSPRIATLEDLPFSAAEQRQEAAFRAGKLSIQGVQPKLSALFSAKSHAFELVDQFGTYIIKPQNDLFPELPENEDVTMRMAKIYGIQVPFHGMVYSKDGSLSYFIKRFDRYGKKKKHALEDFAQLTGNTRETKYSYTMEKIIKVLDTYCTFPAIEKTNLFRRVLFCYVTGNEDMHLKNFSLLTAKGKTTLSPAYDLLNSTIALKNPEEEMALTLKGKKNNFKRADLVDYYGKERLGLNYRVTRNILDSLISAFPKWKDLIRISFLSDEMKNRYLSFLEKRLKILEV